MNSVNKMIDKTRRYSIRILKGNDEDIKYFNSYKEAMKYYKIHSKGNDINAPNKKYFCLPEKDEYKEKKVIAKKLLKEIFDFCLKRRKEYMKVKLNDKLEEYDFSVGYFGGNKHALEEVICFIARLER